VGAPLGAGDILDEAAIVVLAFLSDLLIKIYFIPFRQRQLLDRNDGGFLHQHFNLHYCERVASAPRIRKIHHGTFELFLLAPDRVEILSVRQENVSEMKPYVASFLRKTSP
jgi:hypothetical protein